MPNNQMTPFDGRRPQDLRPIGPTSVRVSFREDFFIFEPQANVLLRLTRGSRITAGAGYRVIGGANRFNNQLRGVTGTIALELGPSHWTTPAHGGTSMPPRTNSPPPAV